jgi:hypothetical protein
VKILAITRREPGTTFDHIQALQVPEAKEVWRLMGQDLIREIYFDPTRPAVVLVLEAESIDAAQASLAMLPMVAEGRIGFDFLELRPYRQLSNLFAPEHR